MHEVRNAHMTANLTVPNVLTAMRIAMAIIAALLFILRIYEKPAVVLCVVATLLDAFDGWYARTFSQCSKLGEHLDPMADKLLIAVMYALIAFRADSQTVWLLIGAIAVREIGITLLRAYSLRHRKKFIPANSLGKAKMISQSTFGVVIIVYAYFLDREFSFPEKIVVPSLVLILLISYYSAFVYLRDWRVAKTVAPVSSAKRLVPHEENPEAKTMVFGK